MKCQYVKYGSTSRHSASPGITWHYIGNHRSSIETNRCCNSSHSPGARQYLISGLIRMAGVIKHKSKIAVSYPSIIRFPRNVRINRSFRADAWRSTLTPLQTLGRLYRRSKICILYPCYNFEIHSYWTLGWCYSGPHPSCLGFKRTPYGIDYFKHIHVLLLIKASCDTVS